jgi:beta-glucosidase
MNSTRSFTFLAVLLLACGPAADTLSTDPETDSPEVVAAPPGASGTEGAADESAPEPAGGGGPAGVQAPAGSSRCAGTKSTRKVPVKVMTMNLRHDADEWERRFPLIADEIVRLDPDLIGMEEVKFAKDQADRLNDLIQQRGHARYASHGKIRSGVLGFFTGEGVAIFSRWPIVEKKDIPMEENRVAVYLRVKHPSGGLMDIVSTHLHHVGGAEGDAIRLREAKEAIKFANDNDDCHPAFLTGDMNDIDTADSIKAFGAAGFVDSYKAVHGADASRTGKTGMVVLREGAFEQDPKRRIDFVFGRSAGGRTVTPKASIVAFKNHDAKGFYPSDHFGVMTTYEVGL